MDYPQILSRLSDVQNRILGNFSHYTNKPKELRAKDKEKSC